MANTMKVPTEFIAIDKFSSVVNKMTAGVSNFSKASQSAAVRFSKKTSEVANNMAVAGGAMIAPLALAVNSAVKFEDKMADVAKTTGLTAEESENYGKAILDMSKKTRTSISALQDIGVVAGTIGVAKDELVAFTKAGNEFAIALGSDFGSTEEAVTQVAKLKNLFKETRQIDIATSMTKAGSAINEVSNKAGSARNINEFMLRVGALPDAMKPSIQASAALGGFLEDAGLSAEIAAGGFSNLILIAGKNMSGFADQMGITLKEAKRLYETDPTQFAIKFSKSLNKLKPDQLALKLDKLKVGSQESIKVVGALGSGYEKLNDVLGVSNKAFEEATSIGAEAAKKNNTTAGKLDVVKNNMEALSITIGTKLAPILTKLIDKVTPIIEKFTKWADENPGLVQTIAYVALSLLGMSVVLKTLSGAVQLYTAAQWLANAAMAANPIGLIVAAIILLIGYIYVAITHWESFGAAMLQFLGPIGWVINAFMVLYDNWDSIKKAFQTEGIIGGFKRLGVVIFDMILYPLQQVLELLSKIPIIGKAANVALSGVSFLRAQLGASTGENEEKISKLESPESKQVRATANATVKGKVDIDVSAKNGAKAETKTKSFGAIPINLTNTQGAF